LSKKDIIKLLLAFRKEGGGRGGVIKNLQGISMAAIQLDFEISGHLPTYFTNCPGEIYKN